MKIIVPAIAVVLAFLVSTQIEVMHHLGGAGLVVSFAVLVVLLVGVDQAVLQRRLGIWGRIATVFGLFIVVWALNSASTFTTCRRERTVCHRVIQP
jgi:hypothetical protein